MKNITKLRRALIRLAFEAESRAGVPKAEIARARAALDSVPEPTPKVIIDVEKGIAYLRKVVPGVEVEIIDHDNH